MPPGTGFHRRHFLLHSTVASDEPVFGQPHDFENRYGQVGNNAYSNALTGSDGTAITSYKHFSLFSADKLNFDDNSDKNYLKAQNKISIKFKLEEFKKSFGSKSYDRLNFGFRYIHFRCQNELKLRV